MTTIADQISGTWTNAYASTAKMSVATTGLITGTYISDAGVKTKTEYRMYGYIDPKAPVVAPKSNGMPLSLMIYWRAINQGAAPDISWNYVSGMSGQLIFDQNDKLTMQFNHALIVTNQDGAVTPGFYVDRLQYDPVNAGEATEIDTKVTMPEKDESGMVTWVSEVDPKIKLAVYAYGDQNLFGGALEDESGTITELIGLANTHYDPKLGPHMGYAFCGITKAGTSLSLSGWLNTQTNHFMLQEYHTKPQSWAGRFFQSTGRTHYMKPI